MLEKKFRNIYRWITLTRSTYYDTATMKNDGGGDGDDDNGAANQTNHYHNHT